MTLVTFRILKCEERSKSIFHNPEDRDRCQRMFKEMESELGSVGFDSDVSAFASLRIAAAPKVTLDHILVKTYPIFIKYENCITHMKVIVI